MSTAKTNAMRILDKAGVAYQMYTYETADGLLDGVSVAHKTGQAVEKVYKTLVTQGHSGQHFVFVVPVAQELQLKAAAKAVGEKSVEMIKPADITKITGYLRGGCSPIGMKKAYPTVLDASCKALPSMIVSAGKIGAQMELSPADLQKLTNASFFALCIL